MSRDKQIEEMAKIMCTDYCKGKCTIDGFDCGEGFCSKREKLYDLYNAGYRKASDLAEEIFAEIERMLNRLHNLALFGFSIDTARELAELKKKYTEEVE